MKTLITFFTLIFTLNWQIFAAELDDGLYANLNTNKGDIIIKLSFEKTPLTVINFVGLALGDKKSNQKAGKPFYDGLKFHRVIDDFMIQGGDPKGNGSGGPGYKFADEITDLKHDSGGILSMANSGANTNGSQFFITHRATAWLDGKHTVFGKVVEGMSVVNAIKKDDLINKVTIIRVGKAAKNFKTDEQAFQTMQKYISADLNAKAQQTIEDALVFINKQYPKAKENEQGYFIQINKIGSGIAAKKSDLIKIKLTVETKSGKQLVKAGSKPLEIEIGSGKSIPIIGQTAIGMKVGGKRTMLAFYRQIYGNNKRGIPLDSLMIFNLELLSISPPKDEVKVKVKDGIKTN